MDATTSRSDSLTGKPAESIVEAAEAAGYATGIVTTVTIQHATPAAFYSHRANRDWYQLIAGDMVDTGVEVFFGGGREYMIPRGTTDISGGRSRRTDNRNVIEEMKADGYTYVSDAAGLEKINPATTDRLLGLFAYDALQQEFDRQKHENGEPPLWELTAKALEILSKNPKGFFLMVEAGQIDWAAHANNNNYLIGDAIACDKTVGVASEFVKKHPKHIVDCRT